jgi:uncharacterized membrane protein
MRGVDRSATRELQFCFIGSIIAGILLLATRVTAVDAALSVPFLLYFPGASIVGLLGSERRQLNGMQRLFWAVTSSIAIAIFAGLILNKVTSIDRKSVIVGLLVWTLVISGFGLVQIRRSTAFSRSIGVDVGEPRGRIFRSVNRQGNNPASTRAISSKHGIAILLASFLVLGSAIAISQRSITVTNPKFVQLWLLGTTTSKKADVHKATVGVRNDDSSSISVLIRLREQSGGGTLHAWHETIAPGQEWTTTFVRPNRLPISTTLALESKPNHIVEWATLQPPSA